MTLCFFQVVADAQPTCGSRGQFLELDIFERFRRGNSGTGPSVISAAFEFSGFP